MAAVSDPQGAGFWLYRESGEAENPAPTMGAIHWTELWTPDLDGAVAFYEAALALTATDMNMAPGTVYKILKRGETTVGGAMSPEGAPAAWIPWVAVPDVDASIEQAKALGGSTMMPPQDVPEIGRLCVVIDPAGAALGLITPAYPF